MYLNEYFEAIAIKLILKYHWRIEGGKGFLAPPPPKIG